MAFNLDKMYCGMVKRGDIFLGNFGNKEKVMVVLQDSILNERLSTVVVAPIEPHRDGQRVFKNEVLLPERETGLGQKGVCMLHKIQLASRTQMIAKKGEVSAVKLQDIYAALDINLGRFRDRE